jgi:putative hydrolase of the HAD superfamily
MERETWMIFDFAGVIGLHQPKCDQDAMVAAAGNPPTAEFWDAYWSHRDEYDAGRVTAAEYWFAVAPAGNVQELIDLDVASWLHPDEATVSLLGDLAGLGHRMALLSNAPLELAKALESLSWLARLDHLFFSSRLGVEKPDPAIYLAVADRLGVGPESCVFVDDRPVNVAGANDVGMTGILFTDAHALRMRLL